MHQNICYNCGGEIISRGGRLVCAACGSYLPEQISGEEVSLLYSAFQKLRLADFYEAEREFDDIIRRHPRNAQAYWGRLMSRYGIKYEKDYDGRNIPTCYATSIDSVYESYDYRKAMELADTETRAVFKDHADYMERVRREWLEKASREQPYDIFISFKDSDQEEQKNGREHTVDSDYLRELYLYLMKKGYRVFFSRESLEGKGGEKYEPYIYAALSTAKIMLVYGSKPEYINATWVKNEWTRYQKRIRSGEKHPDSLIVAYKGFSPKDLPLELSESGRQHLDASKPSFYSELIEIIGRIMGEIDAQSTIVLSAEPKKEKPIISALHEHSYKKTVVKPTCVAMGYTLHQCECGEEYRDSYTPLADHKYKVTNRIEPTCKENGKVEEICEICGQKQTKEIPALGHQFSKWTEAKRPTCTENGEEQRQCQRCGEIEKRTVSKTGHSFGDWTENSDGTFTGYCKNCGATKTKSAIAEQEKTPEEKQERRFHLIFFPLVSLIVIGCILGFIYLSSSASTFKFKKLPDGTYAVTGLKSIPSDGKLEIPSSYMGKPVTAIGNNFIGFYDQMLTAVVIPDSVTSIGDWAFYDCSSLTSITIPDSVTSIGDYAFYDCSSLTSVTIGNSVTSIGERAFRYCSSLTSISIPDGVTSIGGSAFEGCSSLTSITIPDSVTSIGDSTFSSCRNLTKITLPNSITSISRYAFFYCSSLTSIQFGGTIAQWNAMSFGSAWNSYTGDYKVTCTDGTISK